MPQILNTGPGFGAQLGESLGGGFSAGIQALAQHKLGRLIERQERQSVAKDFESAGFNPQESNFIASQPAQFRPQYIQALLQRRQQVNPGMQQERQIPATPAQQEQAGFADVMSSLNPRPNPSVKAFDSALVRSGKNPLAFMGNNRGQQQMAPQQEVSMAQQQPVARRQQSVAESLAPLAPKLSASEAKQQLAEHKQSLESAKGINNAYKAAQDSTMRLDRMQKLVDSGKLNGPLFSSLVKGIHVPLVGEVGLPQGWLTPESQEFDKLSTDFVKGAKDIFGSRMTQGEVDIFLKTVPSLTNSDEGKKVLIRNLKLMNEGAKIKKIAMDKIRKENGGKYPSNLEELIEEVAGPKLEKLKEKFVAGSEDLAEFDSLPDPAQYVGRKIQTPEGTTLTSNGTEWV